MLPEIGEQGLECVARELDDAAALQALRASCRAGRKAANAAVTELRVSFN